MYYWEGGRQFSNYNLASGDHDALLNGSISYSTDQNGNANSAIEITKDTDNYIDTGIWTPSSSSAFSVAVKFYFNTTETGDMYLGGQYDSGTGNLLWAVYMASSTRFLTFVVFDALTGATTDQTQFYIDKDVNDGEWHNLVGTFDSGLMVLYLDGEKMTPVKEYDNATSIISDSVTPFFIGAVSLNISGSTGNIDGKISMFATWNRALLLSEVKKLYNNYRI